jgi:hypothetical protein
MKPFRPAMICVADVDERLACSGLCVTCRHYMTDRRRAERRDVPRRTRDRRVLNRAL